VAEGFSAERKTVPPEDERFTDDGTRVLALEERLPAPAGRLANEARLKYMRRIRTRGARADVDGGNAQSESGPNRLYRHAVAKNQ
jgi:hypothetical protein